MNKVLNRMDFQSNSDVIEQKVHDLIARMTLAQKIGQMNQQDATGDTVSSEMADAIRAGQLGSVINLSNAHVGNQLQKIAIEESPHGIPLVAARDVIHGFKTIQPIPLGQAATWNPDLVQEGARIAALEARRNGIHWTFAPMIDISRDARWGRIAESFGEDPVLTAQMGVAMVKGFQGDDLSDNSSIAACAKHFAGYGASETGRDYNTTNIPENELRNIYLPPFKAAAEAGVATFMASFSDIDGIPASANEFLFRQVLREEWQYKGMTISDWDSIRQLSDHGLTDGDREAALQALIAGIDMEMAGDAYLKHIEGLIDAGLISEAEIDQLVGNILRLKFQLGLFENPYTNPDDFPAYGSAAALSVSEKMAEQSIVLLKNEGKTLPLDKNELANIAIIGPMANEPYEQLGTWIFDGDAELSVTPKTAIETIVSDHANIHHTRAFECTRNFGWSDIESAVEAAEKADVALLFLGEESILSGEAHSRADIDLPGRQAELVKRVKATGTPIVAVILAGRPLTLSNILNDCDALVYAWHPGSMGGPAIANILFGEQSPSGRLPVSFPRAVGQLPLYYNHKNTGRPATDDTVIAIDEIPVGSTQTSLGMTAFHLDVGYRSLFPFGFGLSYTEFEYSNISISQPEIRNDETLTISAKIENVGDRTATEVVQLYVRDHVGSLTRPVKELKDFQRIELAPGEKTTVQFELNSEQLGFYRRNKTFGTEPGKFSAWIGPNADADLEIQFNMT